MKKIILIGICVLFCASLLSACSSDKGYTNDIMLKPTEAVDASALLPEESFLGTYKNEDYTAEVTKADDGQLSIIIKSAVVKASGSEWHIEGFFSETTYRVNYTDAVKENLSFDKTGKETSRETEYDYGSGRIQFDENGKLVWLNGTEKLSGSNELTKEK